MLLRYDITNKFNLVNFQKQFKSFLRFDPLTFSFFSKSFSITCKIVKINDVEYSSKIFISFKDIKYNKNNDEFIQFVPVTILEDSKFIEAKNLFKEIFDNSDINYNCIMFDSNQEKILERLCIFIKYMYKYDNLLTFT